MDHSPILNVCVVSSERKHAYGWSARLMQLEIVRKEGEASWTFHVNGIRTIAETINICPLFIFPGSTAN